MSDLDSLEHRLTETLRGYGRVGVAFSAGVDSTVVAAAAFRACGDKAIAITGSSASLPSGELEAAKDLARKIGIRHVIIETREFSDPNYVANPTNRCFYCKTELYLRILSAAETLEIDVLVNGANLDDRDDYRPGMQAAERYEVRSPLIEAGLCKSDVRLLAQRWELPNAEKPASPCLSSRLAYGVEVTPERLARVDAAERWLKTRLRIAELRVRHESHELARVEVPLPALPLLVDEDLRRDMTAEFRRLGFRYVTVDLEGFRSGSLNALVSLNVPSPIALG